MNSDVSNLQHEHQHQKEEDKKKQICVYVKNRRSMVGKCFF